MSKHESRPLRKATRLIPENVHKKKGSGVIGTIWNQIRVEKSMEQNKPILGEFKV